MIGVPERRYCVATDVVTAALPDGVALLSMNAGQYFGLNEVGAFIWDLLQTPISLSSLVSDVQDHFEIDTETARFDIEALLKALAESRLVDELPAGAET